MKNPSLDRYYSKIGRSILLAEGYTEIDNLSSIIKACRLKPVFSGSYKLELYRHWLDEFSNSFKIIKNKRIKIVYNDLEYERMISTDLYCGLSLDKIFRMSKLAHLLIGTDEDIRDNYFLLTFLGIDNYLRSYLFMYGEWAIVSPLMLGMKRLQSIFKHTDIKYFHELSYKKDNMTPCEGASEWISFMPLPRELLEVLKRRHDVDFSSLFTRE